MANILLMETDVIMSKLLQDYWKNNHSFQRCRQVNCLYDKLQKLDDCLVIIGADLVYTKISKQTLKQLVNNYMHTFAILNAKSNKVADDLASELGINSVDIRNKELKVMFQELEELLPKRNNQNDK